MNNATAIRRVLIELFRRLDLPLVELAPATEAGRTQYFTALEAADRRGDGDAPFVDDIVAEVVFDKADWDYEQPGSVLRDVPKIG